MRYPTLIRGVVVSVGITAVVPGGALGDPADIRPPLIEYLELNTEELTGFEKSPSEPAPEIEINSFAFVNLEVNESVGSVNGLIEKIRPYSYIIRAQVKRAGTDNSGWRELRVTNPFTKFLISDTGGAPTESGFDKFELRRGVFDTTPYLDERTYVTVIDGGIFDKWIDVENELKSSIEGIKKEREEKEKALEDVAAIKAELAVLDEVKETIEATPSELAVTSDTGNENYRKKLEESLDTLRKKGLASEDIKRVEDLLEEKIAKLKNLEANKEYLKDYLKEIKTIFRFNAANCYIQDENGNSVNFSAEDGDELRIQIFRIAPLVKYDPSNSGEILYPESEMYFTFREYGWFIHVSPAAFYVANANFPKFFNAQNFNVTSKTPGGGFNLYLSYMGTSGKADFIFNRCFPSLSFAIVDYFDKEKIVEAGTPKETTVKNEYPAKFSLGLSWPFFIKGLRDKVNFTVLLYDLDLDHVLFGVSLSPSIDIKGLFSKDGNPRVKVKKLN
jgi:hypothetical protein